MKNKSVPTLGNALKNTIQDQKGHPSFGKSGSQGGGLFLGLLQDGSKVISNFLLESQAKEVIEALQNEEAKARGKINVIAGND